MRNYLVVLFLVFVGVANGQTAADIVKDAGRLADKDDFNGAIALIDKAIKINPNEPAYYFDRAIYLTKTKEFMAAKQQADSILILFPGSIEAYLYCADFELVTTININGARMLSDSAIDKCKLNDSTMRMLVKLNDELKLTFQFYLLGILAAKPDSAFSNYVVPDSVNAEYLSSIAYLYDQIGLSKHAVVLMKKSVELHPKMEYGFNNLGFYYNKQGEYDKALTCFDKSIELNKKRKGLKYKRVTGFSYSNRGHTKFMQGKIKEALIDFAAAKELVPTDSYLYYYYALLYISQNKTKKTCESLHRAKALGFKRMYGDDVDKLIEQYCK